MNKASGEAKNSAELIEEVAGRWDTLSEAEQRNTAVGVAGIYQLSRWNALMLNFGMSQDAATTAMDSQNSAMREQEEFSKSLEARINRLKTEWTSFASTAGDAVLYDGIVVLTEVMKNLTSGSESVVSNIGLLAPIFGIAGVAAYALSTSLRGFIGAQIAAASATVATTGATGLMAGAMALGATAVNVMKFALRGLLIATGVGVALAGLGFIVEKLTTVWSKNIQAQEEFDNYTRKNTEALTTNKVAVEDLISQYNTLSDAKEKGNWDSTQEQEYLKVQQTLSEMYPALIAYTDASGQAHLKSAEAIQKETDAVKQSIKELNAETLENAISEFDKLNKTISGGLFSSFDNFLSGSLQARIKQHKDLIEARELKGLGVGELKVELAQMEREVTNTSDQIKGKMLEVANAISGVDIDPAIQKNLEGFLRSLDTSNLNSEQLKTFSEEFGRLQASLQEAVANEDKTLYRETIKSLNELAKTTNDADFKRFTTDYDTMVKAVANGAVVHVEGESAIEGLGESAGESAVKVYELKDAIESMAGISQSQIDDTADLIWQYETLTSQMGSYTEAQIEAMVKSGNLTSEEMALVSAMQDRKAIMSQLDAIYPSLLDKDGKAIKLTEEKIQAVKNEQKANEVLLKAYKLSRDGKLNAEQDATVASAKATKERIEFIKTEIAALSVRQKAYQEMYAEQAKMVRQGELADLKAKAEAEGATAADKSAYNNYGRGAAQAGRILGQNSAQITSYASELEGLQNKLNGNVGSIDSFSKAIEENEKATKKSKEAKDKDNKATEESIYLADKHKQKLEELNLAIQKQIALRENLPQYSDQFIKSLETQAKLENEKLAAMKAQEASLLAQIKSGKIQETGLIKQEGTAKSISKNLSGWSGQKTSDFGYRTHPTLGTRKMHEGIDIAGKKGTRLDANISGKVIGQGYNSVSGNFVKIEDSQGFKHFYGHLDKAFVKLGDMVDAGTQIGNIGSTGRSTGPHLHYQVQNALGKLIDPSAFASTAKSNKVTTTSGGKSVGTLAAEGAQSVDQARSDLISIQNDILAQEKNIKNLAMDAIEAQLSVFDRRRQKAEEVYGYEEAKLKNVDKFSERYGKTIEIQRQQLVYKQSANNDELEYLDKLLKSNTLTADAQDEIKSKYNAVKTAIQEVNNEIGRIDFQKFVVNEQVIERQNDLLAYNAVVLESLSKGSERYQKVLEQNEGLLKTKQATNKQELEALAKMIESGKYSGEVLEEMTKRTNELFIAVRELALEIQNNNFDIIMNVKANFDEGQDDIQFDIDRSELIQAKYVEGSKLWRDEVDKQIALYGELASSHDAERRKLQEELKSRELTAEQIKEITELLEDETLAYLNATTAIEKLKKETQETEKKLKKQIADDLINAYKAYVGERRDEHMKMLDNELKSETKAHEARKKQLKDEMDLFRKNVEERLQLIDRQEAERGYNMEIEDMEKERSKVQGEIDKLSLDDSREAKSKRKKLQEQLDKIDKDIAEKRHGRDIELQKQGLNDLLESKEQEIDGKIELEDKQYQAVVDRINREKEYWTKHYNDLLNDERKFAQLREDIMSGSFDKIGAEFQVYIQQMIDTMPLLEDSMDGTMQAVGTSIRQNVIDALNDAINKMGEFNSMSTSGGGIGSGSGSSGGGSNTPFEDNFNPNEGKNDMIGGSVDKNNPSKGITESDMMVLFAKYMREQLVTFEPNEKNKQAIRDKADSLASRGRSGGSKVSPDVNMHTALAGFNKSEYQRFSQYILSSGVNQVSQPNLKQQVKAFGNRIASLDTGGMLSTSGSGLDGKGGRLFIGHDGEVVNNPLETSQLLKTAEISSALLSKLSNLVSPMLQLPQLQGGGLAGEAPITITFGDIYNTSQDSAKSFARTIINDIKTRRG